MTHTEVDLVGRVALAFVLSFVIGFERELRGSAAGDRTYALVGLGAAAVTAVTQHIAPQAIGGVVTGVGFIGAGLVWREGTKSIRGMTSAAGIFVVAGLGVVAGSGHWLLALVMSVLVLVDLELRNIPLLRMLDARRYGGNLRDDMAPPMMTKSDQEDPPATGGSAS